MSFRGVFHRMPRTGISMGLEASTIEIGIKHDDLVDDGKSMKKPFVSFSFPKDELEKYGD